MQVFIAILVFGVGLVIGNPTKTERIVGGEVTIVRDYPSTVALLYAATGTNFRQTCGGSIVSTNVILTAARCPYGDPINRWRTRVGSSFANSGGSIYALAAMTIHPAFNYTTFDSDIALMYTTTPIELGYSVRAAKLASTEYSLADNQVVWAVGWGRTAINEEPSEQLRHIQIWTVNQATCKSRYAVVGSVITDNMLCAGWLNVGGRDQCQGDSGGPLYHNDVVVGISSWGIGCADPNYPGVNTRVSEFAYWIHSNS